MWKYDASSKGPLSSLSLSLSVSFPRYYLTLKKTMLVKNTPIGSVPSCPNVCGVGIKWNNNKIPFQNCDFPQPQDVFRHAHILHWLAQWLARWWSILIKCLQDKRSDYWQSRFTVAHLNSFSSYQSYLCTSVLVNTLSERGPLYTHYM